MFADKDAIFDYLLPSHWRVVVEPEVGFRIEPRGYYAPACTAAAVTVALIVILWLVPSVTLGVKIAVSALGVAAGATVVTFFVFVHRYERRLGPYVFVDRSAVHLRHGHRILLRDFASFEVTRRWELTGDGETQVAYLVLRSKSGDEVEILVSMYHREMTKLKRTLDDNMSRILTPRSRADSSAS